MGACDDTRDDEEFVAEIDEIKRSSRYHLTPECT